VEVESDPLAVEVVEVESDPLAVEVVEVESDPLAVEGSVTGPRWLTRSVRHADARVSSPSHAIGQIKPNPEFFKL
jgi:hypothetical protein